jgi:hypothetical protein
MSVLAPAKQALACLLRVPAIGQLLLRCLNSGVLALALAGLRGCLLTASQPGGQAGDWPSPSARAAVAICAASRAIAR